MKGLPVVSVQIIKDPDPGGSLKVVGNEKLGGVKRLAPGRRWYRTVAINVCLLLNVAVIFSSAYFRFLFVELN